MNGSFSSFALLNSSQSFVSVWESQQILFDPLCWCFSFYLVKNILSIYIYTYLYLYHLNTIQFCLPSSGQLYTIFVGFRFRFSLVHTFILSRCEYLKKKKTAVFCMSHNLAHSVYWIESTDFLVRFLMILVLLWFFRFCIFLQSENNFTTKKSFDFPCFFFVFFSSFIF